MPLLSSNPPSTTFVHRADEVQQTTKIPVLLESSSSPKTVTLEIADQFSVQADVSLSPRKVDVSENQLCSEGEVDLFPPLLVSL